MPSAPGNIAVGSFRAIPQFAEQAGPILDLYQRAGRAARWARTTT